MPTSLTQPTRLVPALRFADRFLGVALGPMLAALLLLALPATALGDDLRTARERLESMSAEEKKDLAAKRERFDRLPAQEQQRLRDLHQELSTAPDSEQLQNVMQRYFRWLKTLSGDQRAQLLSKSGEERIEMIRRLTAEQEKQRFRRLADQRLSPEDLEQVYAWTSDYIRSREKELVAILPEEHRESVERIEEEARRWRHLFWMLRHREVTPAALPSDEEISDLVGRLSADARKIFASATDDRDRMELVQRWIRASMFSRLAQSFTEEELVHFLQNELDPRIREKLEEQPREEMQEELRRLYMFHTFRGFGSRDRGPPRFGPPGGRPPPPSADDDDERRRRDHSRGDDRGRRDGRDNRDHEGGRDRK